MNKYHQPHHQKAIRYFVQSKSDCLYFHQMNVQGQSSSYDCGVLAIVYSTELVYWCDPLASHGDIATMWPHLLSCQETGKMTHFPSLGGSVPSGMQVHKFFTESIFWACRMPNDKAKIMIKCDHCLKLYHYNCMSLNDDKSCKHKNGWVLDALTLCNVLVNSIYIHFIYAHLSIYHIYLHMSIINSIVCCY